VKAALESGAGEVEVCQKCGWASHLLSKEAGLDRIVIREVWEIPKDCREALEERLAVEARTVALGGMHLWGCAEELVSVSSWDSEATKKKTINVWERKTWKCRRCGTEEVAKTAEGLDLPRKIVVLIDGRPLTFWGPPKVPVCNLSLAKSVMER
jgi:ribosomal protein S14